MSLSETLSPAAEAAVAPTWTARNLAPPLPQAAPEPVPPPAPTPTPAPAPAQAQAQAQTRTQTQTPPVGPLRRPAVGLRRRLALPTGFWLIVALPTATSAVYFGAIASDVYVSESKFVVRMPQRQQQPSLMGALLQGSGFMRSQDDTFSVHEYMLSRDALTALDSQLGVRAAFAASAVDLLSRFPAPWSDDSFEALYRYYGQRASVSFDAATSISTLRITAFSAKDAHAINAQLLQLGEDLVNRINTRGRGDLIRFAQAEVTQAERRAQAAAAAVTSFRNQRAVYDPDRQSALQLQGVSKVHEELAAARGQLAQVVQAAPQNPQLPSLRLRVQQLEQTLASENARVTGGSGSLTSKSADYDRLALERGFAERQLASALAALETARNEAQRQQLYLERVVQPNLPDHAIEPRRMRSVLATGVLCLLLWGVVSLLLAAVREHRN